MDWELTDPSDSTIEPGDPAIGAPDGRPRLHEPPAVRLVAVADMRLEAAAGLERRLDAFYVALLGFEREDQPTGGRGAARPIGAEAGGPVYRADNFRLWFSIVEPPVVRERCRPIGILIPAFSLIADRLMEDETACERLRGLVPGRESLLLRDPAGNWVELIDWPPGV